MTDIAQRESFAVAKDGVLLFNDDRGPRDSELTPLVCLPGLTRNSHDFEPVYDHCAATRRIIGIDFRGRGRSGYPSDAATYRPAVELEDTLKVLDHLQIEKCAVLGTSRGGIVGMLMAATAPQRVSGLMLNDIGAKLENDGLLRIVDHVGKRSRYLDLDQAARQFSESAIGFSGVSHETWRSVVRRIYQYENGYFVQRHDLRLAKSLPSKEDIETGKIPELWSLMPALLAMPCGVLRGSGSDLLSMATVKKMQEQVPQMVATEIKGRGHVPFLDEPEGLQAIDNWLAAVDAQQKGPA